MRMNKRALSQYGKISKYIGKMMGQQGKRKGGDSEFIGVSTFHNIIVFRL